MSVNHEASGTVSPRADSGAPVRTPRVNHERVDYEYASLLKQAQECLSRKEALKLIHKATRLMQKHCSDMLR